MSVSAISASSGSWEELYGLSPSRKPSAGEMAKQLFKDLDSDQSAGVSLEESGLDQSLFSALDSDGNGTVSVAELEAALENSAMFARMQVDGVGLTPPPQDGQGASDMLAAILNDQVAASDGEQAAASGGGGGSSESEEEYDELDTNQDGVVSLLELEQAKGNSSLFGGGSALSMIMGLFSSLANNSYASSTAEEQSGQLSITA